MKKIVFTWAICAFIFVSCNKSSHTHNHDENCEHNHQHEHSENCNHEYEGETPVQESFTLESETN